jgi:hypothetical protein
MRKKGTFCFLSKKQNVPFLSAADPLYASKPVLLRRRSGSARLTVFDGGHDIVHEAGLTWLEAQRRGGPAAWDVKPRDPPVLRRPSAASGK